MKIKHLYALSVALLSASTSLLGLTPNNLRTYKAPLEPARTFEVTRSVDSPGSFRLDQTIYSPMFTRGHFFNEKRMADYFTQGAQLASARISAEKRAFTPDEQEIMFYTAALKLYIENVYNENGYAQHLSQDSSHLVEGLMLAQEFQLNAETQYSLIRLFYNKYKQAELVDETVTLSIVKAFCDLAIQFDQPRHARFIPELQSRIIENNVLDILTDHLPVYKTINPDVFARNLSDKMTEIFQKQYSADEEAAIKKRLSVLILQFTELLFSKTIWYTKEYPMIWDSVLSLGQYINLFVTHNIITHIDDYDNLLWSLTLRFEWFLKLSCEQVPVPPLSFYNTIESDLLSGIAFFVEGEELEPVKTKKQVLLDAVAYAKTRIIAYQQQGVLPNNE